MGFERNADGVLQWVNTSNQGLGFTDTMVGSNQGWLDYMGNKGYTTGNDGQLLDSSGTPVSNNVLATEGTAFADTTEGLAGSGGNFGSTGSLSSLTPSSQDLMGLGKLAVGYLGYDLGKKGLKEEKRQYNENLDMAHDQLYQKGSNGFMTDASGNKVTQRQAVANSLSSGFGG